MQRAGTLAHAKKSQPLLHKKASEKKKKYIKMLCYNLIYFNLFYFISLAPMFAWVRFVGCCIII